MVRKPWKVGEEFEMIGVAKRPPYEPTFEIVNVPPDAYRVRLFSGWQAQFIRRHFKIWRRPAAALCSPRVSRHSGAGQRGVHRDRCPRVEGHA